MHKNYLAGVKGFEPLNVGIKIRCLTTWRHPNKIQRLDAPLGLEPRFAPSKGDVLPLDEGAIRRLTAIARMHDNMRLQIIIRILGLCLGDHAF